MHSTPKRRGSLCKQGKENLNRTIKRCQVGCASEQLDGDKVEFEPLQPFYPYLILEKGWGIPWPCSTAKVVSGQHSVCLRSYICAGCQRRHVSKYRVCQRSQISKW